MATTQEAQNHYQQLEAFRQELSDSGRSPTKNELQIRANKILDLMRECRALQNNPAVDKSAIPQITEDHLTELQQWLVTVSVLNENLKDTLVQENTLLIPVQHFKYDNKEKSLSIPPKFSMYSTTTDSWHLEWPEFKEQIVQYLKVSNFRQKTAVIMVNTCLETRTRAMVAHIKLDNYTDMPDGNGLWLLLGEYQKIFMAGSETGIPLAKFAQTRQGNMDISIFHATLRAYYRQAYPDLTSEQLNESSELCQKFIDGLLSTKVKEHVIRTRKTSWNTYEQLLTVALHEQATQVNVNLTTASSQASLQAGVTATQLIREQQGIFTPAAPRPKPVFRQAQPMPPPEPMEIGALSGEKCKYCPEKDRPGYKGHTVDNCWKVEKAMRAYQDNQQTQIRPSANRFMPRRSGYFTPRSTLPAPRYPYYSGPQTPFRGARRSYGPPRGRPFRRQVTAAILDDCERGINPEESISYHLAALGIQDEPQQQQEDQGEEEQPEEATEVAYLHDHMPEEFAED